MQAPAYSGRFGNNENKSGRLILRLPGSPLNNCAACGVPFEPLQHWHQLCRQCWSFDRIGDACALFNARAAR